MSLRARQLFTIIAVLAVLGIVVSSVSLQHHYAKSKTSYCDFGESFNCDLVNRSQYSSIAGIPVAMIGIAGYITLLALATFYREKAETPGMLVLASAGGLAFALYLTYVEGFILQAWCILCLSSLTTIFLITLLSVLLLTHTMRRSSQ
jgi:vitamin-K-epoxide reductase (warfarin-sensitive)